MHDTTALPTHPHTGEPIHPIYVSPRTGRVFWPVWGASEDDAGTDTGDQDRSSAGDGQQDGADSGQDAGQSGQKQSGSGTAEKVEDLPDWAQKVIREARREAGDNRTKASAAEQKQADTLEAIAKALGLKKDEKVDPEQLAKDLGSARGETRDALTQLAVYRAAGKNGADADALLDSNAFLAKVRDLDHTAKDFADKVAAAIKDAVKNNPKLSSVQAAGSSGTDHSGGPGERRDSKPKSLADAVSTHYGS